MKSLPNEILVLTFDIATLVEGALSTDQDDDQFCLPISPPSSRAEVIKAAVQSRTTALSLIQVCRRWNEMGTIFLFRYLLIRLDYAAQTVTGLPVPGTAAYAYFLDHLPSVRRIDFWFITNGDTSRLVDPIILRPMESLLTQSSHLTVVTFTNIDSSVQIEFLKILSAIAMSPKPKLRSLDCQGRGMTYFDFDYPEEVWEVPLKFPALRKLKITPVCLTPADTLPFEVTIQSSDPDIINCAVLQYSYYFFRGPQLAAPSLSHLTISASDLSELRADDTFIEQHVSSLRSMHILFNGGHQQPTGHPDWKRMFFDTFRRFPNLESLCWTSLYWNNLKDLSENFPPPRRGDVESTARNATNDDTPSILPPRVCRLGISIVPHEDYHPELISLVFSVLVSSPLLKGLTFVRFLDEATIEELQQSRLVRDYGKKRLELAHVRLEDFRGHRLLEDIQDVEGDKIPDIRED